MQPEISVKIANLSKVYRIYDRPVDRLKQMVIRGGHYFREFPALNDVSLEIAKGHTLGIVGSNGSGKSTLLQIICGTLSPSSGECVVNGRISALLELGAGFNPEFSGKENVYLNALILGLSQEEIDDKYDSIVEFAGIKDFIEQPVKTYSSGMYVRLAFAVAVTVHPDILVVDEALSVGDEAFQKKCFSRIRKIQEDGGTILFVSHSASSVIQLCDQAVLLDRGEVIAIDTPKHVMSSYHKLIFAPPEKIIDIREAIKGGEVISSVADNGDEVEESAEFNPAMKPESTVIYESNGVLIAAPKITTLHGREVNILNRGHEYIFKYQVEFARDSFEILFGMLIKTLSGFELGGSSSATLDKAIDFVESGSKQNVSFKFKCGLLPGTYFMNAGCSGVENGERKFLHRIVDAYMFKVAPESGLHVNGIIDFDVEPEVIENA